MGILSPPKELLKKRPLLKRRYTIRTFLPFRRKFDGRGSRCRDFSLKNNSSNDNNGSQKSSRSSPASDVPAAKKSGNRTLSGERRCYGREQVGGGSRAFCRFRFPVLCPTSMLIQV